jgi:PAS domain S-box-containing protein
MAVRKSQSTAPVTDASTDGLASRSNPSVVARIRLTEADDSEPIHWKWGLRLLRATIALITCFEVVYLLLDIGLSTRPTAAVMALHVAAVILGPAVIAVTALEWFQRNWRPTICGATALLFLLMTGISVLTHDILPLYITVALSVTGIAALVPWTVRWQAALGASGLGTLAIAIVETGAYGSEAIFRWLGALAAVVLAQFIATMGEQYRAELAAHLKRLRGNHHSLLEQAARREMVIAARERAERQLRETEQRLRTEIAQRELAQHQLQASETKFRTAFEATTDSVVFTDIASWLIVDVNTEFSRITGFSREEAVGRTNTALCVWASRSQLREVTRLILANGMVRNVEVEFRHRDGTIAPFLFSAVVVEVDRRRCIVSNAHDISDLKRAQAQLIAAREALSTQVEALRQNQEMLRAEIDKRELVQRRLQASEQALRRIFDTSLDTITVKRLSDNRYVDVNREFERTFYPREEALGKSPDELDLWGDPAQGLEFNDALKAQGQVRNMEVDRRTKDGRVIPTLVSSVIVELGGEPCVVSIARDISRRKRIEQELIAAREAAQAASAAKSEFLSSMSHEIRTPMNAVLGMADLLWETPLNAEQRRYLDIMRGNGAALLTLIDGILDLAKVESGRLGLERVNYDLVDLSESVMESLAIRAHEKSLGFALRIAPDVPAALVGDPLRLRQILINLLGNAIKFSDRGEVTLTIDALTPAQASDFLCAGPNLQIAGAGAPFEAAGPEAERLLRFAVHDTGIGIAPDKLRAVFSTFTQADSTTTRKYGGSGLGLTIVKRLVELMRGQLTAESCPGQGSAFSAIIPVEVQSSVTADTQRNGSPSLSGMRTLVADEASAGRSILAELLARTGAEVKEASVGAAIWEIEHARTAGRPYDVVFAECRGASPSGIEIAQHVISVARARREAVILMLTADGLHARLSRLSDLGLTETRGCSHLVKPLRRGELWRALDAVRAWRGEAATVRFEGVRIDDYAAAEPRGFGTGTRGVEPGSAPMLVRRPLRILLAEDSADNRTLIEAYLKDTPYRLELAENGEAAVEKFTAGIYDIILMDIQMPVMDGYEATAEIRRREQADHRRRTAIIALTASAHDEAARRSLTMGCDSHVTKPVKRSTLLKAIHDAAERADLEPPAAVASNETPTATPESSRDRIVVHLDADLSDLVPGFLGRKREDAKTILAAADRGECEHIGRLGHKMKGEGGSYGLDAITEVGRGLEAAAKASDLEAARGLARELTDFLDRLEIVYRPTEE